MDIDTLAAICHEVNKAYCESQGDLSQPCWSEAPDWQKTSALQGVRNAIRLKDAASPALQHENWMEQKVRDGWTYGTVKDAENKTHPCLVPYAELSPAQRLKDSLFLAVIAGTREIEKVHAALQTRKPDRVTSLRKSLAEAARTRDDQSYKILGEKIAELTGEDIPPMPEKIARGEAVGPTISIEASAAPVRGSALRQKLEQARIARDDQSILILEAKIADEDAGVSVRTAEQIMAEHNAEVAAAEAAEDAARAAQIAEEARSPIDAALAAEEAADGLDEAPDPTGGEIATAEEVAASGVEFADDADETPDVDEFADADEGGDKDEEPELEEVAVPPDMTRQAAGLMKATGIHWSEVAHEGPRIDIADVQAHIRGLHSRASAADGEGVEGTEAS